MIVPSAWDTMKRDGEPGTHWIAVQGELLIQNWNQLSDSAAAGRNRRANLFVQSHISARYRFYADVLVAPRIKDV